MMTIIKNNSGADTSADLVDPSGDPLLEIDDDDSTDDVPCAPCAGTGKIESVQCAACLPHPGIAIKRRFAICELSERAADKAIEDYRNANQEWLYDEFDVDQTTEYLAEFITNCLGLADTADSCRAKHGPDISISWSYGHCQGDGLGLDGRIDLDRICELRAAKELSADSNYGEDASSKYPSHRGTKGSRIIELQQAVKDAYDTFRALDNSEHISIDPSAHLKSGRGFNTTLECSFDYWIDDCDNKEHLEAQCETAADALESYLESYIDMCESVLWDMLRSDVDYHYSDERIKEEIEARELVFTADGELIEQYKARPITSKLSARCSIMDAYLYRAALYCSNCGDQIIKRLKEEGKAPADPDDEYSFDSDNYPKGPFSNGGGEADSPQHCDGCQVFLENPLTGDGLDYVISAIRQAGDRNRFCEQQWKEFYSITDDDICELNHYRVFFYLDGAPKCLTIRAKSADDAANQISKRYPMAGSIAAYCKD